MPPGLDRMPAKTMDEYHGGDWARYGIGVLMEAQLGSLLGLCCARVRRSKAM